MSAFQMKKHDFGVLGGMTYVDDLLPTPAFEALAEYAETAPLSDATFENPETVWQENGLYNPLLSKPVIWPEDEAYSARLKDIPDIDLFPTGTPVDEAIRAIRDLAIETEFFGKQPPNWAGSVASIIRYRPGTRLVWHSDAAGQVGAFSYYIHKTWDNNAGGQFLYKSGDNFEDFEGCFVTPKPNRLVIIRPPLPHAIAPTIATPGNDRIALSGFFIGAKYAEQLMKLHTAAKTAS